MALQETLNELTGLAEQAVRDRNVARSLSQLELPDPDARLGEISYYDVIDHLGELGINGCKHWTTENLLHILVSSNDLQIRLPTLAVFRRVGPHSLEPLTAALRHRTPVTRWLAAQAIGWMGPAASSAKPLLRARLAKERCGAVRARIKWALDQLAATTNTRAFDN